MIPLWQMVNNSLSLKLNSIENANPFGASVCSKRPFFKSQIFTLVADIESLVKESRADVIRVLLSGLVTANQNHFPSSEILQMVLPVLKSITAADFAYGQTIIDLLS